MRINITREEFAILICIYLLDKLNNSDEVKPIDNEDLNGFFDKIKFMKPILLKIYMNSGFSSRALYKRIRDVFTDENLNKNYSINFINKSLVESEKLNETESTENIDYGFFEMKDIVKNTINKIRKYKNKKSSILRDEDLDKLIEKSITEYLQKIESIKIEGEE